MIITGYSNDKGYEQLSTSTHFSSRKKCVFISHKSEDKDVCFQIAEYLNKYGVDVYLDAFDVDLQTANITSNKEAVVKCIKRGIERSTHMLCVVSPVTYKSMWVPFEIGYGSALLKEDPNKGVVLLPIKQLKKTALPDYLHTIPLLAGIDELIKHIESISHQMGWGLNLRELSLNKDRIRHHF